MRPRRRVGRLGRSSVVPTAKAFPNLPTHHSAYQRLRHHGPWKSLLDLLPAVFGDKVFLTTFKAKKLNCRAYDRTKGKLLWAKSVAAHKIEGNACVQ